MALYTIAIDTNEYSGNFERAMCAYITGQVGHCGVGKKEALQAEHDLSPETLEWFEEHIDQRIDKNANFPCYRPCAIAATPGRVNDGMGKHYDAEKYPQFKFRAYESVAIFFNKKPTACVFNLVRQRAEAFAKKYAQNTQNGKLEILNVRLTQGVYKTTAIDPQTLH